MARPRTHGDAAALADITRAQAAVDEATQARADAVAKRDQTIRHAVDSGLTSQAEVARATGLQTSRITQIVRGR